MTPCESKNGALKSYFNSRFSLFMKICFSLICPRQVF